MTFSHPAVSPLTRFVLTLLASFASLALAVFAAALVVVVALVAFKTRLVDPAAADAALKLLLPAFAVGTLVLHRHLWADRTA